MKVLIQQPRVPHYRVALFKKIVEMHGWDVTVLYTPSDASGESGLEIIPAPESKGKLCFYPVPSQRIHVGALSFRYQHGFLQKLRAERWDAVFIEGAQSNLSGWLAALWCRHRRIPCICWIKGYFTPQNRLRRFLNRLQLRLPHSFLPYGDTTHAFLQHYGVKPSQIVRAYNTVDVEAIAQSASMLVSQGREFLERIDWGERRPLVVSVGRLIPEKRVDDLCRAIALLKQQGKSLFLLVVGEGPERSQLEALVRTLGIDDRVHFTGRVPLDMDSALLAVADVAVFCGALGLAINQAMTLGTPVVAADLPGPDGEMVRHLETGWRYRYGDVAHLCETIWEALCSEQRSVVIQSARSEILTHRSLQRYAEAFASAIQKASHILSS